VLAFFHHEYHGIHWEDENNINAAAAAAVISHDEFDMDDNSNKYTTTTTNQRRRGLQQEFISRLRHQRTPIINNFIRSIATAGVHHDDDNDIDGVSTKGTHRENHINNMDMTTTTLQIPSIPSLPPTTTTILVPRNTIMSSSSSIQQQRSTRRKVITVSLLFTLLLGSGSTFRLLTSMTFIATSIIACSAIATTNIDIRNSGQWSSWWWKMEEQPDGSTTISTSCSSTDMKNIECDYNDDDEVVTKQMTLQIEKVVEDSSSSSSILTTTTTSHILNNITIDELNRCYNGYEHTMSSSSSSLLSTLMDTYNSNPTCNDMDKVKLC
jgi:hypothetical protein